MVGYDQSTKEEWPITDGNIRANQPIYTDNKRGDQQIVTPKDRLRTRLLKFIPK